MCVVWGLGTFWGWGRGSVWQVNKGSSVQWGRVNIKRGHSSASLKDNVILIDREGVNIVHVRRIINSGRNKY